MPKLDRYDKEAEREGLAISRTIKIRKPKGKRFVRGYIGRGDKILDNRAQKRHVCEL